MQNPNARFAFALLVPVLLALSISEAAAQAQRQSAYAARAECFRQANEAAAAVNIASTGCNCREKRQRRVCLSRLRQANGNSSLMQCRDAAAAPSELQPIWLCSGHSRPPNIRGPK